MAQILVGTCAWHDHTNFYPAGLKPEQRLEYYARFFRVVEVDSTFYALQSPRNFTAWARKTPEGFVFNVKAYRVITRHDQTPVDREELAYIVVRFRSSLQPLKEAGKLKAVLLQFPPSFAYNQRNTSYLKWCRDHLSDVMLAVEFRHRSWFADENRSETLNLLKENLLVNVICDEPQIGQGCIPMVTEITHPALAIARLHGRNAATWYKRGLTTSGQRFNYLYSDQELTDLLDQLLPLGENVTELHILMNNNFGDYAVRNALRLREMLGQSEEAVSPLEEGTLFPEV